MLAPLVAALCAQGVPEGNYELACNKGYEAVSAQYGIDRKIDAFAKRYEKMGEKFVQEEINEQVAGVLVAVYATMVDRQIRISTSAIPYVQSTVFTAKVDQVGVVFSWSL